MTLLSMDGPGFFLDEASASERVARDRLTFEAWGDRLTREQYLDRERMLRQTQHGRLERRTWVLRLASGVVVASCETYRLALLPTGAVEVVASVFVERALRGVQMGSRLISSLVSHRREAGLDGLVLFSEIGETLYERAGFRRLPAPTRGRGASNRPPPATVRSHGRDSLADLLERRKRWREGEITLRATESLVDWHLARSNHYARVLDRPVQSSVGATDGEVTALWAADHKAGLLRVLEASGPEGASLDGVLAAAANEAHALGLEAVELWDDAHSARLEGGPVFERDDDRPMGCSFTPRGELFLGPLARLSWA